MKCILCDNKSKLYFEKTILKSKKEKYRYFLCGNCSLLFLDPIQHPNLDEERERYLDHNNDSNDDRYRRYILEIATPCMKQVTTNQLCLDYGSGPSKVMEEIFTDSGHNMTSFDPVFYNHWPDTDFDLITSCEVFEHFHNPAKEIPKVLSLLKSQATLAIHTHTWNENLNLDLWGYLRDITHVCFYHKKTIQYLCDTFHLDLISTDDQKHLYIFKTRQVQP